MRMSHPYDVFIKGANEGDVICKNALLVLSKTDVSEKFIETLSFPIDTKLKIIN